MLGYEFFANLVDNIYKTQPNNNTCQLTHNLATIPYLYGNEIDCKNITGSSPSFIPHELCHVVQQK